MAKSPSHRLAIVLAAALLASSAASAQDDSAAYPDSPMAVSWVKLHGHRFRVEIAVTDAQRARGLMFRDHLGAGHGMLFVHPDERPLAYWMKNTRIPLDIFYFDAQRKLVSVAKDTPACDLGNGCPPFRSDGPAMYVLELNAGVATRLHVKAGDTLLFGPGIAPPPAPSPPASQP